MSERTSVQQYEYVIKRKDESGVEIYPFEKDDESVFFIPSGFDLADLELVSDGVAVYDGLSFLNRERNIFIKGKQLTVDVERMDDIPSLFIDIRIGDINDVNSDSSKKEKARAVFSLFNENGELLDEEYGTIKGRGNTSWLFYDKKPYNISFDEKISVFGMPEGKKWCLIANETDPYFISNSLVYDLASGLDLEFVPQYRLVNVFIDGQYNGLYLITERVEVEENRLNIKGGDSYLLETDLNMKTETLENYFISSENNIIEIHYPADPGESRLMTIESEIEEFEKALCDLSSDRWKEMIDVDSWARVYLIDELFENVDGGFCSVFFYKNNDGKYVRGPIWDYDRCLNYGPYLIMAGNENKYSNEINLNYNYWLLKREEFRKRVKDIYEEEFLPSLGSIESNIEILQEITKQSLKADSIRWNRERSLGGIYDLISARSVFLDDYFRNDDKYCKVQIEDEAYYLHNYIVNKGDTVDQIEGLDESLLEGGLYYKDSGKVFDIQDTINEDTCLVRNRSFTVFVPDLAVYEENRDIGLINRVFVAFFLFCFVLIVYIISKRIKNG